MPVNNLSGLVYSKLTVGNSYYVYDRRAYWLCTCECGNKKYIRADGFLSGLVKSCGCYKKSGLYSISHGQTILNLKSAEYSAWNNMKSRCYGKSRKEYKYYGGRGIIVCDRWLHSFENFFMDMGNRPTSKHSLDRKNVNGNYCLENCRWVLIEVQASNKTNNHILTYEGVSHTISEWARIFGIFQSSLSNKLKRCGSWEETYLFYMNKKLKT